MVGSLPHHALRDLAGKHGPLMHLQLGEVSAVVVSSAEVAREVLKTHDITFASRSHVLASKILLYDSMDVVFSSYGEYWRQLRKICTHELLNMKSVQSFWWIREEEVSNLVKRITLNTASPVNVTENLFSLAYSITATAAFGKKCRNQEQFITLAAEAMKLAAGFDIADVFPSLTWLHIISGMKPQLEEMRREIEGILAMIINEHREARANKTTESDAAADLTDVPLKFEEPSDHGFFLSTSNIKAVIFVSLCSFLTP